jgi:SAM-dependent methyltransferase
LDFAMSELQEHVARNRAYWDDFARQYVEAGERAWAQEEPAWGIWQVPEAELQIFFGATRRQGFAYSSNTGLDFPLIHGDAEAIAYPNASFDFAISEYGACLWADPQRWVPEVARLLRPGGQLVFLTNSFLMTLCMPPEDGVAATERLLRPAFGMYRIEWPGKSRRRVSSVTRRLDTAAAAFGLRGRGSNRGTACRRSNLALSLRHFRVGP